MRRRSGAMARVAVLAVFVAALSGCSVFGIPTPGASPTRTATPTPTPAFAFDCATAVSDADLTALLGAGAKVSPVSASEALLVAAAGPLGVPGAGGASCTWTSGNSSLEVRLLPHAADTWAKLAQTYPQVATPGADYDGGVSLGGDCVLGGASGTCHTNVLVDGAWLSVVLKAASTPGLTEAAFHDVVQRMLPAVTTAVSTAPPARTAAPFDCAADELRAEVQSVFARPDAATTTMGLSFDIGTATALAPGAGLCQFLVGAEDDSGYLGSLSVLPDAGGVFETFRQAALAQDSTAHSESISVGGSTVPALVWGGETEGVPYSSVDVLRGTTWIQFQSIDMDTDHGLALIQWVAGRL